MNKHDELLDKQQKYLFPNHIHYYSQPMALDRGEGMYVWDVEGGKYLDFFAGILTTSVGHSRPEVNKAVKEQTEKLIHSSTLYPNEVHITLAERLANLAPGDIQMSYFMPSGSDADELAVMIAQAYTGNREVVALRHGYSGRSIMGMSLTGQSTWRVGNMQVAGITHAINPYCYRCPLKMEQSTCGYACAEDVKDTIQTTTSGKIAAFIAEPIQGVGGFITPPKEYFSIVYEIVKEYGGLFISDEVQTGFGRTGKHWWGIEHSNVQPDIITMAKGIANGFPLSNTMTRPEIAESIGSEGLMISTFGGNPVACAASVAVLDVLEEQDTPSKAHVLGDMLRSGLDRLKEKYPIIGDVRGRGLMQGLELVLDRKSKEPAPHAAAHLMEEAKAAGVLIGKGGLFGNVLRIAPPLTVEEVHIAEALEKLDKALDKVQRRVGMS
ncbi:MAG: aspartate aminotransferase family protein [Bacteroidota bacterium]